MAFTTINKSTNYFNSKLWTGTGSTNALTGVGFQPDFTWIKSRSDSLSHALFDAVRGTTKVLNSNANSAEYTNTDTLTAFGTDGFTVGSNTGVNANGETRVAWNWKAGTTSIPSGSSTAPTAVSINATAGFGIYEYTGTGYTGRTLAHGLNSAPKMMIVKRLNSTRDWGVYHSSLANTEYLELNNTTAEQTGNWWGNTTPTSSLIYLGNDGATNGGSDPFIMYAFSDVQGYSKFSSYVGNGDSDGPFIYTGFKPAFFLVKRSSDAETWLMYDNKRLGYNAYNNPLQADSANSESTGNGTNMEIDLLSNGIKIRGTVNATNSSGSTYIYMAFAEAPLVGTNNIPANAR
jgi:hypothetical protein